ncbi:MAG: hypothetical protein Q7W05_08780 [Deltaproteobacteria bacterium]|nr:hypothetical protein [Deltaproteobacteria bacterium]
MPTSPAIATGQFYAQMKAPKREQDMATGMLRYRWTDTGDLVHYRLAHGCDFLGERICLCP